MLIVQLPFRLNSRHSLPRALMRVQIIYLLLLAILASLAGTRYIYKDGCFLRKSECSLWFALGSACLSSYSKKTMFEHQSSCSLGAPDSLARISQNRWIRFSCLFSPRCSAEWERGKVCFGKAKRCQPLLLTEEYLVCVWFASPWMCNHACDPIHRFCSTFTCSRALFKYTNTIIKLVWLQLRSDRIYNTQYQARALWFRNVVFPVCVAKPLRELWIFIHNHA